MIAANMMMTGGVTLSPENTLLDALRIFSGKNGGVIPVVGPDGRVIGVITPALALKRSIGFTADLSSIASVAVEEAMETAYAAVSPEAGISSVAASLSEKGHGAVVVVDDGGRLLGVISPEEILKRICEYSEKRRKRKA
ncbi:MAG: CBS domain-containing protein [Deltaproteobacteria bacterium]|nr:CBS domain-containing protein [Deltaproteobacteria bacterium]